MTQTNSKIVGTDYFHEFIKLKMLKTKYAGESQETFKENICFKRHNPHHSSWAVLVESSLFSGRDLQNKDSPA